jgi:cytochrome c553
MRTNHEARPNSSPNMTAIILVGLLSALGAEPAAAQSAGEKVLQMGGENAEAPPCISCHGADLKGMPENAFPRLAGLPAKYLIKQLRDFRSGSRENAIMQPIASALSDAEIVAVASELAGRPRVDVPKTAQSAGDPQPGTAAWLALRGDWSRKIPECTLCHGPSGIGVGDDFPPLAAQSPAYIQAQLEAFRPSPPDKIGKVTPATRRNDTNDLMRHIAQSLTDPEIKSLSEYFGNLGDSNEPFDETRRRLR